MAVPSVGRRFARRSSAWLTFSNRLCAATSLREDLEPQLTTIADLRAIAELRNEIAAEASPTAPHRERRASHRFQVAGGSPARLGVSDVCVDCGYAETGHIGLTAPEQHVITDLLNQLQTSPFMRRRILRKLDVS